MKAWFFGLAVRERWIIGVGAAVAVAIIFWGFVVRPLRAEVRALRTAVETKQRLLVDVARVEVAQPTTVVGGRQGADQSLSVVIDNTAAMHGLGQPRTRADGPSSMDVTLQGVPYDAIVDWLVTLHDTYGVDVESASFASGREPGVVNGQVSLHRF
jgi:type II secretory pathway component PulM